MREKKEINVQVGRQCRKAREAAGLTQVLMGDLGGNDVDAIASRLRQLPPEQFRVVREVINRVLELTTLSD